MKTDFLNDKTVKYSEDILSKLPKFPGKCFLHPNGHIVQVDNYAFVSNHVVRKLVKFFNENGLGDNTCILAQGLVKYVYVDDKDKEHLNCWPMIYVDASITYPTEVVDRVNKFLDEI